LPQALHQQRPLGTAAIKLLEIARANRTIQPAAQLEDITRELSNFAVSAH